MNPIFSDTEIDRIYSRKQKSSKFTFNEEVVNVFPDMIRRSAPGYTTIVENIGHLASMFAQDNTKIYDLGSSLGAVSMVLRSSLVCVNCEVIAVDSSAAMVEKSREYFKAQEMMVESLLPIRVIESDILSVTYEPASIIAMNFTLQFIPKEQRLSLLTRLKEVLVPNGALFLSEKIRFQDNVQDQFINHLHIGFKRANGYSELEIAQKRESLEEVMVIDTFEEHHARLIQAGFKEVYIWFQCMNFVSMIAVV